MVCQAGVGDYLCPGWRKMADRIRARDSSRCRGCNREGDVVRLEVHHRRYGSHGECGACILTGVTDEDCVTLCIDCHDGITDVRRRVRYATQTIEVTLVSAPETAQATVKIRTELAAEMYAQPPDKPIVTRRSVTDIIG